MTAAERHNWTRLNRLQLGKYAEYLAKMEFVLHGCDVFTSEVDDHGIDFVVRTRAGRHYDVQVKSYRPASNKYVFLQKSKFPISPQSLLALGRRIARTSRSFYALCEIQVEFSRCRPNGILPSPQFSPLVDRLCSSSNPVQP